MEEDEGPESSASGAGAVGADGPDSVAELSGGDSIAMTMALNGASREEVEAFLRDQRALIGDQRHYLNEKYKRLVEQVEETALRLWELRLGILLRAATLGVGLAAAAVVGLMVWDATRAHGLVIEAFATPPDLVNRGISGEVVAAKIQDQLIALQEATDSSRAPQSYANNWGDIIKVEIPQTGVSIGELRRFLREWLGHDTRISGELYRTTSGIAVTARASGTRGATFEGAESELDALIQKAAEQVYSETQPYRFANYLDHNPAREGREERVARAAVIYRKLIAGSDVQEQAWAWYGLGSQLQALPLDDNRDSVRYYRKAVSVWPDLTVGYFNLAGREFFLDHETDALADSLTAARLLRRSTIPDVSADTIATSRVAGDARIAYLKGDYGEAARLFTAGADMPNKSYAWTSLSFFQWWCLLSLSRQHDGAGARAYMQAQGLDKIPFNPRGISGFLISVYAGLENWPAIVALEKPSMDAYGHWRSQYPVLMAIMATAKAKAGDLSGASALIASSPDDCDECLVARARIAGWVGQYDAADRWFARAEAHARSTPFADTAWGQALLERGQSSAAIKKLAIAHGKGPHFADPLELWGEALMKQNQSHLALAKFVEAERYAPNWKRLHLKWGEALGYVGKKAEAQKHLARAARL